MRSGFLLSALLLCFTLVACRADTDDIGRQVTSMLQSSLDTDAQFKDFHLKALKVEVVRVQGNEYRGMATVRDYGGDHPVPVKITYDGSKILYETEPGAFAFVVQTQLKKAQDEIASALASPPNTASDAQAETNPPPSATMEPSNVESPAPVAAVAQPISPSFDCTKARSDAEHLICSDNDLASLDNALASQYHLAKSVATDKAAFTAQNKAEWLSREQSCHDKPCLLAWYERRRAQLQLIIDSAHT